MKKSLLLGLTLLTATVPQTASADNPAPAAAARVSSAAIDKDIPTTPSNVLLTETELSWSPVTTGLYGTPLEDVTYSVGINGVSVGTTSATIFSVSPFIHPEAPLESYIATVTATARDITSSPGISNKLIAGTPWSAPFEVTPTEKDLSICTTGDTGNGSGWTLHTRPGDEEPVFLSGDNSDKAAGNWIFFPAFTGRPTSVYTISFEVSPAREDFVSGTVEVWIGTSPSREGMKRCLIPALVLSGHDPVNLFADFVIDSELAEAGALYIGLAAGSREGESSPVMVNKVKVTETAYSLNRPSAVTRLTATPSEKAAGKATVTFTLPDTLLDGTAIPSTMNLQARIEVVGMKRVDIIGSPGEVVTTEVEGNAGYNLIVVTPQLGNEKGLGSDVICRIGFGRPGPVRNLRISYPENDLGFRIDWDAPNTDYYGDPATGDDFSYRIWRLGDANNYELASEVPAGTTHAEVTLDGNPDLVNMHIAVTPVNNEGEGPMTGIVAQIGEPYLMPLKEDFNGDECAYNPFTVFKTGPYAEVGYRWGNAMNLGLSEEFQDPDTGDLIFVYPLEGAGDPRSKIWIPKFSTIGFELVQLELYVWTGADAAETTVSGWAYGMEEMIPLKTLPRDKEMFQKVPVPLDSRMTSSPWVQLAIESSYPTPDSRFLMAGYAVKVPSGVKGVAETLFGTITGGEGCVTLAGFDGQTAEIFTLDGRKVTDCRPGSDLLTIPLPRGIYVVKAGRQTARIVVR